MEPSDITGPFTSHQKESIAPFFMIFEKFMRERLNKMVLLESSHQSALIEIIFGELGKL
ncbi:hypothetical protein K443DRAFT_14934 [Laccaria amethystina LaAM-08-1]|uniref:Uncharacterized protein n=1 Tax=Laccaria amethystina LaAM-08-1 TaxID=1095629 RepID=A0A0C9WH94_9AGAR|nr:hypothetical protein K443DRAFT_14934 [Laccaria amethystina LaAM-08-1]